MELLCYSFLLLLLLFVGPSTFEAVCTLTPVLFPRSSPEALQDRRRERPLLAEGGIMGDKWSVKFSQAIRLPHNCWVL
jgi:hypothetical protein